MWAEEIRESKQNCFCSLWGASIDKAMCSLPIDLKDQIWYSGYISVLNVSQLWLDVFKSISMVWIFSPVKKLQSNQVLTLNDVQLYVCSIIYFFISWLSLELYLTLLLHICFKCSCCHKFWNMGQIYCFLHLILYCFCPGMLYHHQKCIMCSQNVNHLIFSWDLIHPPYMIRKNSSYSPLLKLSSQYYVWISVLFFAFTF